MFTTAIWLLLSGLLMTLRGGCIEGGSGIG
jgi:hypothetical protein